ncbi:phage portal protein [Chitinophaga sp. CF418]|uniref:phage portal protein n=1 Tax=Chitinophaga sp. CF418 TaxID=1855287 RepID=UPI0009217D45|nr:phage portal protein [Chitinophaga sp. CF418]SHN45919.1 phage portal protein, lambda family [Chitinophaga sp. CF418]
MQKSFFDRAIEFVSPKLALQRYQARAVLHVVNKNYDKILKAEQRKYDAASKGRHYSDWHSPNLSVNQEILHALSTLRERSRDLCRNNAYAINAVRVLRNNVVGTGIIPNFKKGPGISASALNKLKTAWTTWGGKTGCDYDDMNTFSGLQSMVMRVVAESGECLVRRVRGTSEDVLPLRLQLLEGDRIDGSHHTGTWDRENTITYYGIKFDKSGRRLGYWIYKGHPSEYGGESEFVSADNIVHIYEVERPGQIRGIPLSCGVMLRMKDLEDYEFTERIRSKVAAAFAVFVVDNSVDDAPTPGSADEIERIEPGMIKHLVPGQDIKVAQPPTVQGFGEFVKNNLRGISAGFGTSYESLTNDYSNVNFSSGRMGWIEMGRNVEHFQFNMMIPRLCDKVLPWFIEACQLKGIIGFNVVVDVSWTPPRREMIDPYKEIQALKEGIRAGIYSWQDVVRMCGYIPEELKEELKQDAEMWDTLKLRPTVDPRFDANRPPDESNKIDDSEKAPE